MGPTNEYICNEMRRNIFFYQKEYAQQACLLIEKIYIIYYVMFGNTPFFFFFLFHFYQITFISILFLIYLSFILFFSLFLFSIVRISSSCTTLNEQKDNRINVLLYFPHHYLTRVYNVILYYYLYYFTK